MKFYIVCIVAIAFVLVGCGKSAQEQAIEAGLNEQITKLHETEMAQMTEVTSLADQIDAAIAKHDSLLKALPKLMEGHSIDDLNAAKDKLMTAKKDMDTWMKAYKPYDANLPHDQVLPILNQDLSNLTVMKDNIQGAITSAKSALTAHTTFAQELLAKVGKKR